ncbi:MAG: dethiobiotin synthase [Nitrososphaeraceae archaeon]
MKGIFITGTDTDVGKTIIASGIVNLLDSNKIKVGIMKPFACSEKRYSKKYKTKDVKILIESIKNNTEKIDEQLVNPVFYNLPTAPYLAAKILKKEIVDIKKVIKKYEKISKNHEFTIVEGIGGIMVPLTKNKTVIDMIKEMNLSVIVVTTNKIGTINHTILTIQMCKKYSIPVYGIIINNIERNNDPKIDNALPQILQEMTGEKIIANIPFISNLTSNKIKKILEKSIDIYKLIELK